MSEFIVRGVKYRLVRRYYASAEKYPEFSYFMQRYNEGKTVWEDEQKFSFHTQASNYVKTLIEYNGYQMDEVVDYKT